MAQISVRQDSNQPGGAVVTVANGGASPDSLRYFIRRMGHAEPNLSPSGWRVAECALEPSGAEVTPQGLEVNVPAEIIRHLEDGNYEFSVSSDDGASLSGVLSWEGSVVPRGPSERRSRRRGGLYGEEPSEAKEETKTDGSEPTKPDEGGGKEEAGPDPGDGTPPIVNGDEGKKKRPIALIAGAMLVAAVIGGGLYYWLTRPQNAITAVTDSDDAANSVSESAAKDTTVGVTGLASDADSGDTVTYALTDDAGGRFQIDTDTGVIRVADGAPLDYETATSHEVTVTATSSDGSTSTETFTVDLTDDNSEFAVEGVTDGDDQANSVSEGAANDTGVGITAAASDADGTDVVTYALTDDAGGRFRIDENTGIITVADSAALDFETATTHDITVTATSTDGTTSTQTFTINVTDDLSEIVELPPEPDLQSEIEAWLNGDPPPSGQELLNRANELLDLAADGNAEARILAAQLLRKAVRERNAEAALAMGRYFDPRVLSPGRLRQRESSNPRNAYRSYRTALKLGAANAAEDLAALKAWAQSEAAGGNADAQRLLENWVD